MQTRMKLAPVAFLALTWAMAACAVVPSPPPTPTPSIWAETGIPARDVESIPRQMERELRETTLQRNPPWINADAIPPACRSTIVEAIRSLDHDDEPRLAEVTYVTGTSDGGETHVYWFGLNRTAIATWSRDCARAEHVQIVERDGITAIPPRWAALTVDLALADPSLQVESVETLSVLQELSESLRALTHDPSASRQVIASAYTQPISYDPVVCELASGRACIGIAILWVDRVFWLATDISDARLAAVRWTPRDMPLASPWRPWMGSPEAQSWCQDQRLVETLDGRIVWRIAADHVEVIFPDLDSTSVVIAPIRVKYPSGISFDDPLGCAGLSPDSLPLPSDMESEIALTFTSPAWPTPCAYRYAIRASVHDYHHASVSVESHGVSCEQHAVYTFRIDVAAPDTVRIVSIPFPTGTGTSQTVTQPSSPSSSSSPSYPQQRISGTIQHQADACMTDIRASDGFLHIRPCGIFVELSRSRDMSTP